MDALTRSVRDLYEAFPYPSGPPTLRLGADARYLLSQSALPRPGGGPIRVLDAGCGRGSALLGAAATQPEVEFLGVDLNRVGLAEARAEAGHRGLANARFAEVDVQTLAGLEAPPGGFDVIHSCGVIHHLADPDRALALLGERLAPHGVLALMVYGRRGPVARVAAAIEAVSPASEPLDERLRAGRALVRELHERAPDDADWESALRASDTEFVDRYLHPCERAYDVPALFSLIEGSGLRFLEWASPEEWEPELAAADGLGQVERFRLAEKMRRPGKLELYLCRPEGGPRPPLGAAELLDAILLANPEVVFEVRRRHTPRETRIERVATKLRLAEPVRYAPGALASAVLLLSETEGPFLGRELVDALVRSGRHSGEARATLRELVQREVLFAPHPVDVGAAVAARSA